MKTLSLIFVTIMFAVSNNLTAQNLDFRNTTWGMDSNQVKKNEKSKLINSNSNSLIFNGKLADFSTKINYFFTPSNKLYRTSYIINLNDENPQSYINSYILLQQHLTQKYKEPYSTVHPSINGRLINQDDWAYSLVTDNIYLGSKWNNGKTDIVLSLFRTNNAIYLEIYYTSVEFNQKYLEEKKLSIINDL
jgi:hypothetical protein